MRCLVGAILKQESDNNYLLLLPSEGCDGFHSTFANAARVFPRSRYYSIREQIELPRILREHKVDLLHSPHFLLPLSRPCPALVTIHDVIYLACPEDLPSRVGRAYYAAMMHASARLASRIITVSNFSKQEIVRYLRTDPAKIEVVHSGVDPAFKSVSNTYLIQSVLSKHCIDRDFILYTGIYKRRKNHAGLLKAFKHFLGQGGEAQLVIAGPMNNGERSLRDMTRELQLEGRVVITGGVDDSELCALYSAARIYACPSLYEGFGFTVLEAMACGAPVVCSDATALPEVAGGAALYANARNPEEFAEALFRSFTDEDLRRELIARGYENLRRFSWDRAAESCLRSYDTVAGASALTYPVAA